MTRNALKEGVNTVAYLVGDDNVDYHPSDSDADIVVDKHWHHRDKAFQRAPSGKPSNTMSGMMDIMTPTCPLSPKI